MLYQLFAFAVSSQVFGFHGSGAFPVSHPFWHHSWTTDSPNTCIYRDLDTGIGPATHSLQYVITGCLYKTTKFEIEPRITTVLNM